MIEHITFFQDLNHDERSVLERVMKVNEYEKKSMVFREGEPINHIYFINRGIVKLTKISEGGREQILRVLFPGDFFAPYVLIGEVKNHANAIVINDAEISMIPHEDFKQIMISNPMLSLKFSLAITERLYDSDDWSSSISLYLVEKRIARYILYLKKKLYVNSDTVVLPFEKKELASFIGTTAETLSRKLSMLHKKKCIRLKGRNKIQILNNSELLEIAGL